MGSLTADSPTKKIAYEMKTTIDIAVIYRPSLL